MKDLFRRNCLYVILLEIKTFTHFSSCDSAMQRAIDLQLHYVIDHPKVGDLFIFEIALSRTVSKIILELQ